MPIPDGFFIDEEGFGDLGDGPSGSEEDDGFDAIRFLAVPLKSMQAREGDMTACKLILDRLLGPAVAVDLLERLEALEAGEVAENEL